MSEHCEVTTRHVTPLASIVASPCLDISTCMKPQAFVHPMVAGSRFQRRVSSRDMLPPRICPRCCAQEPEFFNSIRAASPAVLAERGLGIASMQWSGTRLCVYISTVEDIADEPGAEGATVDDCEFASTVLGDLLDEQDLVPAEQYTLEVSSPGTGDSLKKEREFVAFKGFPVTVRTITPFKENSVFHGTLKERTQDHVKISVKGKVVSIPRDLIADVCLVNAPLSE
jgi:ribosome maturation factor RimP